MSAVTKHSAEGTRTNATLIKRLSELAEKLGQSVSTFRLPDDGQVNKVDPSEPQVLDVSPKAHPEMVVAEAEWSGNGTHFQSVN